jgi:hypothetical protein
MGRGGEAQFRLVSSDPDDSGGRFHGAIFDPAPAMRRCAHFASYVSPWRIIATVVVPIVPPVTAIPDMPGMRPGPVRRGPVVRTLATAGVLSEAA